MTPTFRSTSKFGSGCVSENFDVDSLFEIIVKEAEKNGSKTTDDSFKRFQSAVSGKRYLLVLDDVWNRDANKWKNLKSSLCHGAPGSSVLTTTRDENVTQIMGTIKAHKIKCLEESYIEKIIKTRAFGSAEEMPKEYEKMVGDIANRCKGSPLAATALGHVLRTKNTVQEWEDVLSRNTICDEENGILPILKLSYNCLPPHMRQCFAFCAMFPKDHEIDVEMLIRLWMANSFIPEQQGVCREVTGKQIFNELAQRSFFQEVKQVGSDAAMYPKQHYRYCARTTCKIHDLMHDVAQDSMGKECATVDTKLNQSKDFPYSARHLFLSVYIPRNGRNASPEKGSPAIQTLIYDERSKIDNLQHLLAECRSLQALKTNIHSFLEPKYLRHLRYLDLSGSDMRKLPKEITILYHLETLNLSGCYYLKQLPMAMKYMTALRHLYTHGCAKLKSMPPNLRCLTSLQTLTCFVAGIGLNCSNIGELKKLDLGDHLELSHLENATGEDAKAANLGDKKKLEELELSWDWDIDDDKETHKVAQHKEVLEGLKPHDGIKALRMDYYGGRAFPKWMLELKGMVELELRKCKNLEKLPALWELPALQFLYLDRLDNLHCLFSGGPPSKFQELEAMVLEEMPKFVKWWGTNEVQGEEPIFPKVKYLRIWRCGSLEALPKASVIAQPSSRDDTEEYCRSAFPALREMSLCDLEKFTWGAVEGERVTFPSLEDLKIEDCPEVIAFPEARNLSKVVLCGCSQQASLQAASRYITSLSSLKVVETRCAKNVQQNWIEVEVRGHESPLEYLNLRGCHVFFSHPSAPALWKCFGKLACLEIWNCNDLVSWPENLFRGMVSLRTLQIRWCRKLTGLSTTKKEASNDQSAPGQSGGPLLPRLESLEIIKCESLVHVPNLWACPLKTLHIGRCDRLSSMVFVEQQEDCMRPADTSSSSLIVPVSTSADNHYCFFPCLESLTISRCHGLTEVANLPPSIKTLRISNCDNLESLSREVPSLEKLDIASCKSLQSLPNGPYSSLRVLEIKCCESIKLLPGNLEECLDHLDEKELDSRHLQVINDKTPEQGEIDSEPVSMSMSDRKHQEQVELDSKPESMSDGASAVVVLKRSSSTSSNHSIVFPCLESLALFECHALSEVANLPPSIKTLNIFECCNLVSLSGEFPTLLEELKIIRCQSLESLPNGPAHQAYSSLRVLRIKGCPGIKQLPPSLQQRLDHLQEKELDLHLLQGKIAALMNKLACFKSRGDTR